MKKFLFAVISLCLAASAIVSPLTAFATGTASEPDYPEIFNDPLTFESLSDFAIANDNLIVFAEGNTLVHWSNENKTVYKLDSAVTNLDYDAESKKFYYSLNGGYTSYVLPSSAPEKLPDEPVSHSYDAPYVFLEKDIFEGYHYYYQGNSDVLYVLDESEPDPKNNTTMLLGFFNAKVYNNTLYAINDNCLYTIVGASTNMLSLTYSNYNKLATIPVGDIPEKLKTYGIFEENPQLVKIEEDAFLTEIDSNNLISQDDKGNEVISIIEPKNLHKTLRGDVALLLYESDKVRIVAHGKSAYILKADGALNLNYDIKTPVDAGTTATVNVVGEYAHSLPYMSNATRMFALAPNEVVTVISKISNEGNSPLAHTFYLIENADGERGYVIDEFLGELNVPIPDEGGANTTPDPDPHTDDYIRTVVLVIVVIMLVLIAAGYITWVCTSNKQNKPAKENGGEIDLNNTPDSDKKD